MKLQFSGAAMRQTAVRLALLGAVAVMVAACGPDTPESLVASGNAFMVKKDPRAASIQFKAALQIKPDVAETRMLLARALLDSSDPAAAVLELNKALELGRPKDEVVPLLARALMLTGDHKRVVNTYEAVELGTPQATATLKTVVSTAWLALGNREKAAAALAAAAKADPDAAVTRIAQARVAGVGGDIPGAIALLDKVIARDAAQHEAWALKGDLLAATKDDAGANAALRKALAVEPSFVPAHVSLISSALRAGKLAEAKAQLEELRKVLPQHPQTLLLDTQIAFMEGQLKRAQEQALLLLRAAPDNASVLLLAGALEAQAGSALVAESHFVKALQINPDLPAARLQLAVIYLKLGQPARAIEALKSLLSEEAPIATALALAGDAQLRLGDPKAAEALFLRAAKADPQNRRVQTALALTHLSRGDAGRTFAELGTLAQAGTDTVADLALVSARLNRREWDAALAALDGASKKDPKNVNMIDLRGRIQLAKSDLVAARQNFEQALEIDPKFFSATANLAAIDVLEKKTDAAKARLEAAVKADVRNFYASMALAELRGRAGAPSSEVRPILLDAIKGNPSESGPRLMLVEINLRERRFTDAIQAAQDAQTAIPNDPLVLDALGRAQAQGGNIQQAMSTFRKLSGFDPRSVLAHSRLADLYRSMGDRKAAEASWRRVLEIEPGNAIARGNVVELAVLDKRSADALAFSRQLQQREPAGIDGYLLEAAIHERMKALPAAAVAYRAAMKRDPANAQLAARLHDVLTQSGKSADANQLVADWTRQRPSDGNLEYQIAAFDSRRGNFAQAEARLRPLVERFPKNAVALNNLAFAVASQKKPGAVAFAERAVAELPNNAGVMDTLALALAAEKQFDRALEVQQKAVALAPDDLRFSLNLAKLAIQADNKTLARAELDRLSKRGGNVSVQDEAGRLLKTL